MRCWNFGRIYKKVTTQDVRACHCPLLCTRWREEGSAAFKPTACQVFRKQHLRWREAAWLPLLLLGLQCKLAFHISEPWLVAVNMAHALALALAHALAHAHSQAFKQKVSWSAAAARSQTLNGCRTPWTLSNSKILLGAFKPPPRLMLGRFQFFFSQKNGILEHPNIHPLPALTHNHIIPFPNL